jgi:hypothetical protein
MFALVLRPGLVSKPTIGFTQSMDMMFVIFKLQISMLSGLRTFYPYVCFGHHLKVTS